MTRTVEAAVEVDAPPHEVWRVVSDLRRMGEWSPQCVRMWVLGDTRVGTRTINLNRAGPLFWPTTSRVVRWQAERELAFRVPLNRTVWTFELEPTGSGTRLTQRRLTPDGISRISHWLTDRFPGGTDGFEEALQRGVERTLARVRDEAERRRETDGGVGG